MKMLSDFSFLRKRRGSLSQRTKESTFLSETPSIRSDCEQKRGAICRIATKGSLHLAISRMEWYNNSV